MVYSSLDNKLVKDIKKLNQKKYRDESDLFLVEGEHLVMEAYKHGYLKNLIYMEGTDIPFEKDNICVTEKVMRYISELDNPQPYMGICYKLKNKNIGNRILVLDNIQDPGNLGTIIRSSVAFNFDTIILSKETVDLYNSKVIRASQGLIFNINFLYTDLVPKLEKLKKEGYMIIGTSVNGGKDIKEYKHLNKLALVMGNEGQGVSDAVLDVCDTYAYIEMNKLCESLNVGVATSIMLYELNK